MKDLIYYCVMVKQGNEWLGASLDIDGHGLLAIYFDKKDGKDAIKMLKEKYKDTRFKLQKVIIKRYTKVWET